MSDASPPGQQPETIGRYRILERIGQGGMGKVYRAVTEGPEGFRREVALKVVLTGTEDDDLRLKMFHDEARIVARLTHPGIAQVYDFGVDAGRVFLVMELVPGLSMHTLLTRMEKEGQRMPEGVAMAVGTQVASALAYAHAAADESGAPMGLVHRDISPDNLVVTEEGWVKLLDFGIVKAAGRDVQTQLGQVKGKPAYMAPEQVQGQELDGRSDIFALGVILGEALAGERLWRGDTMPAVIAQLVNGELRHLADLPLELHAGAIDAVMSLLARDKAQRPDAAATQAMLSRTLSAIRAGSPQEIVTAWLQGKIAPAARPGAGPGAEQAWAPPPPAGEAAGAPAFDGSDLPPLEAAFEGPPTEAPSGLPTELEGRDPSPSPPSTSRHELVTSPSHLPEPAGDEPALELAYEPHVGASPGSETPGLETPEALLPPDLSAPEGGKDRKESGGQRPPPVGARTAAAKTRGGAPPWALVAGGVALLAVAGGLAFTLAGEEEAETAAPADGKVTLRIETTPPGAELTVNGTPVSERSPTTVETLALREHEITAHLPGHVSTTMRLSYTQVDQPVKLRLQGLVRVTVETTPPGAEVTADGRVVIVSTPGSFEQPPGTYRLLATLEGRAPAGTSLTLEQAPVSWKARLPPAAYLRVKSRPPGAELLLDGVPLGVTTPAKIAVAPRKALMLEAKLGKLSARKKVRGPRPGRRGKVFLRLVDPVAEVERRQAELQEEGDRLEDLIQSATDRMETGILSEREVRQIASSRDTLRARQERLYQQLEKLEERATMLRAKAAEARRPAP